MMEIFLSKETLLAGKERLIFVDTCILLDFAVLKKDDRENLFEVFKRFIDNSSVFITIEPVVNEFLLGTRSKEDLLVKKKYLDRLVETVIPIRTIPPSLIEELILEYGIYARGTVSYTDLCLGAAIKHYQGTYLLTRNYKDFPLKIFNCQGIFTLHFNNDLRTYCFYMYGKKTVKKRRKNLDAPF